MKVTILTKDDDALSREATALGKQLVFEGYTVVDLDLESEDGQSLARLYDVYSSPAVLVTTDNGGYIELWQGEVPLVGDVRFRIENV
jgi:hypothetical protein